MNPIVTHIISGDAFYSGSALLLASVLAWKRNGSRFLRLVTSLAAIISLILIALSGTPLPVWLYVLWSACVGFWMVMKELQRNAKPRISLIIAVALVGVTITAHFMNAPYIRTPRIPLEQGRRVYVIGDSLSAYYNKYLPWPNRLASEHGVDLVNFAQPGATLQSAISQASGIKSTNCLVILLIGGNDILGATSAEQFEMDLNRLFVEVQRRSKTTVMFELPLPPFKNQFGNIQRTLSAKFGVILIPKRRLAYVIGSAGATVDGLHLSDSGHEQMAKLLWQTMAR